MDQNGFINILIIYIERYLSNELSDKQILNKIEIFNTRL